MANRSPLIRALLAGAAIGVLGLLSGCDNFDLDFRNNFGNADDTSDAVRKATQARPKPDNRGVISYPNYQVAVARRGDTVTDVADRVGLKAGELARYNGITANTPLRKGEVIALPRRVSEPSAATGAVNTSPLATETVDISTLAGNAIDSASTGAKPNKPAPSQDAEPVRHKVERGETAYTISRLYNVSVRSLAEWNGLGANLSVREGQYLLIPLARETRVASAVPVNTPGTSSATPIPPSSTKPLPAEKPIKPASVKPPSPDLGAQAASSGKLLYPVSGKIIRAYSKKSDGIDISAKAGSPVKAADKGTVAAITRDTEQVPILVLRHSGNLLTIYANIADIKVKKGDKISRGQVIAKVRKASPAFVHFEVRKDFDSVDPMPYLE
ncbi:MAG: peptidase M23 [Rhodobacterales bacterium]|nr:MAG: peptidase M23 [Rhodobacterales bacterium]